jgi:15-cis-phytoene synthase
MNFMQSRSYEIFKTGSVTFFTASLFFPRKERLDVFNLYAFVRIFDDFVDSVPQKSEDYFNLKSRYYKFLEDGLHGVAEGSLNEVRGSLNKIDGDQNSNDQILINFIELQKKCNFDQEWLDAFFTSMEMDMNHDKEYIKIQDTEKYIYGSAEVIGLMMARVFHLPDSLQESAQYLGKAFQYMNMIRDIAEDILLGRSYLPKENYQSFGLNALTETEARHKPELFQKFIREEILRYRHWRAEAEKGFAGIPKRFRIPIQAASDMFDHTINLIEQDPLIVFKMKIKPSKARVVYTVIKSIY